MIIIETKIKHGVVTPKSEVKSRGFGTMFDGTNYLIFESAEERDANVPLIAEGEQMYSVQLTASELTKLKELLQ